MSDIPIETADHAILKSGDGVNLAFFMRQRRHCFAGNAVALITAPEEGGRTYGERQKQSGFIGIIRELGRNEWIEWIEWVERIAGRPEFFARKHGRSGLRLW